MLLYCTLLNWCLGITPFAVQVPKSDYASLNHLLCVGRNITVPANASQSYRKGTPLFSSEDRVNDFIVSVIKNIPGSVLLYNL